MRTRATIIAQQNFQNAMANPQVGNQAGDRDMLVTRIRELRALSEQLRQALATGEGKEAALELALRTIGTGL